MRTSIQSHIEGNVTKTYLFLAGFVLVVLILGYVFGQVLELGNSVMVGALFLALISSLVSYYFGDQIVIAMSGARPADRRRDFDFFTVTENLCIAANIPRPKLYVIEDTAMNAFATGRDPEHAVVCATTGILSRLDRRELEGVIAHELSHVKNYDIRLMVVVAVLAGVVAYMADIFLRSLWWGGNRRRSNDRGGGGGVLLIIGILLAILTPIMASIIQLAISRNREYLADASGADLTRNPQGLAHALEKLAKDKEVLEAATNATAHLFITNPFKDKSFGAWFANLFNTHPPIEERIRRLQSM